VVEVKRQFLERTKALWQQRAHRTLTDEDARQIVENMVGFVQILDEWEKRGRAKKSLDKSIPML